MATKKITNDTPVVCKNGVRGELLYKSTRNQGYFVEWYEYGEPQEIDFGELVIMRGSQRRFFEQNWILIEDAAVLKALGVERYYKNTLTTENFDEVFKMTPAEIRAKVPQMCEGLHNAIRIRARELVASGELDSRSVIKALNEVLKCDLEETL